MTGKIINEHRHAKFTAKTLKPAEASKVLNLQEAVTVLGGTTGIFVAILWLTGRSYISGYYRAMNIPSYQLVFSVWEYAEVSWLRLFYFLLATLLPPILMIIAIYLIVIFLAVILQKILSKFKIMEALNLFLKFVLGESKGKSVFFFLATLFFVIYLLPRTIIKINDAGYSDGMDAVLRSSHRATIYSSSPLSQIPNGNVITGEPVIYRYTDLKLLTHNDNKYYLYYEVDPNTCRPKQVYILPDTPTIHLILEGIVSVEIECKMIVNNGNPP